MSVYNFTDLSSLQQSLLTLGGWHVSDAPARTQPGKSTVAKLIARGLVLPSAKLVDRVIYVTEYTVPTAVHIAWCERCARKSRRDR